MDFGLSVFSTAAAFFLVGVFLAGAFCEDEKDEEDEVFLGYNSGYSWDDWDEILAVLQLSPVVVTGGVQSAFLHNRASLHPAAKLPAYTIARGSLTKHFVH